MADVLISNLDRDGERRPFAEHGHATLANAGAVALMRGVFEPGWRWSTDVQPIAKTDSCQVHHHGYVLSGSMRLRMDDGTEHEVRTGDLFDVPPGHDAWVTGDEPCEVVDVSPQATRYAVGMPADLAEPDDSNMKRIRRAYDAFNAGDFDGLRAVLSQDVMHHAPGTGRLAGTYKGIDAVLDYYEQLAVSTDGTLRCDLAEVHGDGAGHVITTHQLSAMRDGRKRVSREALLFTFTGDMVTDVLELHADLPGDDAFFG